MNTTLAGHQSRFPEPNTDAQAHSQQLIQRIKEEILTMGPITFARYMDLALYAPQFGYYATGTQKFGRGGDFITAPEISTLFSQCLARQCQQVLPLLNDKNILEFGAGTGRLAADLLLTLEASNSLPQKYYILEVSPDLKQRQHDYIKQHCPHLQKYVQWLHALPTSNFEGIILANEIIDAMPIHRFRIEKNNIHEIYVNWQNDHFTWHLDKPSSARLTHAISTLLNNNLCDSDYYESEINLLIEPWIASLNDCFKRGLILIIDYGFPQHEYYLPERKMGTLMCHYQHRAHTDPLVFTGLQDITSHVDFTALAESAVTNNFDVSGYTTQANFLLSCGITDFAMQQQNTLVDQININQQLKKLIQPHEMGELFKVLGLTRDIDIPLLGFQFRDLRGHL